MATAAQLAALQHALDEAVSHSVDLALYANGVVHRMVALLNRTDSDLFAALRDELSRAADSDTAQRLQVQLESVRQLNSQAYLQLDHSLASELREFAGVELDYQTAWLRQLAALPAAGLQASAGVAEVSAVQVYAAATAQPFRGRLLAEWAQTLGEQRLVRMRDAVRIGFVEQESVDQIIRRIRGTRAAGYSDGIVNLDRRHAEAVVRTAVQHTAAVARDQLYRRNEDIVGEVMWVSTLDNRTTDICKLRDRKRYTAGERPRPVGHKLPWLGGPGKAHWNAVAGGTLVTTLRGQVPVEEVLVGDYALTHRGRFRRVTTRRCKPCEGGVVRAVHVESGGCLRATHEHPVAAPGVGWKFVGALEPGDELRCYADGAGVVASVQSGRAVEPDHRPALRDDERVAALRLALFGPVVELEAELDVWAREVEDRAAEQVLRDPEGVEAESLRHHLLAFRHALGKLRRRTPGCGVGDLVPGGLAERRPAHALGVLGVVAAGGVGRGRALGDAGHAAGVVAEHARGVSGVGAVRFFGETVRPVVAAGRRLPTSLELEADLVLPAPHRDPVPLGVGAETCVGDPLLLFDLAKRDAIPNVAAGDELGIVGGCFRHDRVLALELQNYTGLVYDLEVEDDASYVADGIVVSNCRSTAVPVLEGLMQEFVDQGQRAAQGGPVGSTTSYGDWLKRQSAARQDEILGATRGRLFRAGGLKLEQFANERGKWLTLDQLRERAPAAFARAGV